MRPVRRYGAPTQRERACLALLAKGLLNKQIAYQLGVTEATVKAHVAHGAVTLGVSPATRVKLAMTYLASLTPEEQQAHLSSVTDGDDR